MYQPTFGSKHQIKFNSEADFYQFLGFLAKNDGTTVLVWEPNHQSGAWGQEGRIIFLYEPPQNLGVTLSHTAGIGRKVSRVNCNEFLENIRRDHSFVLGEEQDVEAVRNTVPPEHHENFNTGLQF